MKTTSLALLLSLAGSFCLTNAGATEPKRLTTPKQPVTDEYHGVKVEDPYQWLENEQDQEVKAWSDALNQTTREYLDHLPDRVAIEKQLQTWYAKTSPSYSGLIERPGKLFALKFQPPKQQPMLTMLTSFDDVKAEKILVDPNTLDTKGTTTIDWFVPSHDGKLVAVSLSHDGSEDGTLHFYDVATGKTLPDTITRVQYPTAGGSAAWNASASGIYYTRFPRDGERGGRPAFLPAGLLS